MVVGVERDELGGEMVGEGEVTGSEEGGVGLAG